MLSFISAKEAAEKWNISQRRVSVLCSENRINGAMMVGNMWIIPSNAEKQCATANHRFGIFCQNFFAVCREHFFDLLDEFAFSTYPFYKRFKRNGF